MPEARGAAGEPWPDRERQPDHERQPDQGRRTGAARRTDRGRRTGAARQLGSGPRPWVVGVTGASGTPYAAAVLCGLLDAGEEVDLIVSREARLTLLDESDIAFRSSHWREDVTKWLGRDVDGIRHWEIGDFAAGPSSGSYRTKGMIVVPATTASVAGIAAGISKDLLQRAGDVTLKERRPLVLVVRETPLRRGTLLQLAQLAEEGAVVLPASPGFYSGSASVQQLVDFVAGKVLDIIGVDHDLYRRWTGRLGTRHPD